MKDLKKEIQELKERLAVLEGMVSEQQITRDYGKFLSADSELHYWINHNGVIDTSKGLDYNIFHNCFPTQQAAEAEAKYTLISRQYRNFARKLNGDWKPDWNDVNDKFGVVFDDGMLTLNRYSCINVFVHQVSFQTEAHAQLALEVFGNDLLILCS